MLQNVLATYSLSHEAQWAPFGNGLINHTWKVESHGETYILQKINQQVFQSPQAIDNNIRVIQNYLKAKHPQYFLPTPIANRKGETLVKDNYNFYRLVPFVKGAHSFDVVTSAKQAYEAAKAFGKFTQLLAPFQTDQLQITLKDFHALSLRYQQFQQAIANGNSDRIKTASKLIAELQAYQYIVEEYKSICTSPQFKMRVTHHDTKISNVLFDEDNNSICIIDLDTIMPGLFISDVGDMMRTYLSPVNEEEKDVSLVGVREDYFKAIVSGYLHHMHGELTETEKKHFVYAGKFMIYMQALRFITDYLNNDIYYGAKYRDQNLVRAQNQAALLFQLSNKEEKLQAIVVNVLAGFNNPNAG